MLWVFGKRVEYDDIAFLLDPDEWRPFALIQLPYWFPCVEGIIDPALPQLLVHVEFEGDGPGRGCRELEGLLPPASSVPEPKGNAVAGERAVELPTMDPTRI